MSIRALAKDLYKAQQCVDHLEKELKTADPENTERLCGELRQAQAELRMLKKMMAGEKEGAAFRKKYSGFK